MKPRELVNAVSDEEGRRMWTTRADSASATDSAKGESLPSTALDSDAGWTCSVCKLPFIPAPYQIRWANKMPRRLYRVCRACEREQQNARNRRKAAAGIPGAYQRSERVRETAKAYSRRRAHTPEGKLKVSARHAVRSAIRAGRLVKQPCERCGSINVHAHHDDYAKPLDVKWFCIRCHFAYEREVGLRPA